MKIRVVSLIVATCGILLGTASYADYLDKDGIIRTDEGRVKVFRMQNGFKNFHNECPTGTHLPTAREFAEFSVSQGANPILESLPGVPPPPNYWSVRALNPDGTRDDFYFNAEGYKIPDIPANEKTGPYIILRTQSFLTSSMAPGGPEMGAWVQMNPSGSIGVMRPIHESRINPNPPAYYPAIRCFPGPAAP